MFYLLICAAIAFWGYKRGLNFFAVLAISVLLTPIVGSIYVCSNGKIRIGTIVIILFLILPGLTILFQVYLKDSICNYIMDDLDYASSNGTKIVTFSTDTGKYSWEYIPDELEARNQNDVGYVLEVSYDSKRAYYTGGYVEGEIIYANLIDCDDGRTIANKTFEAVFPNKIKAGTSKVFISESEVSDWVMSVCP